MIKKPKIAWFSNDRDKCSLSHYYTELLVPRMSKQFNIIQYGTGEDTKNFLSAFIDHEKEPFDLFFYQFENYKNSNFVRAHLGLIPGVVLIHDFFLTDDGPEPLLNSSWSDTLEIFLGRKNSFDSFDKEYVRNGPHASRESSLALVPVFSLERNHLEFNRIVNESFSKRKGFKSFFLPCPVEIPEIPLVSSSKNLHVGFCGSSFIEHRSHKILKALKDESLNGNLHWMLDEHEIASATELLKEFEFSNVSFHTPRCASTWLEVLKTCNVCVHTLFSSFGHLLPYLPISLCSGRDVLITNFGSSEHISDKLVWKIEAGTGEDETLRYVFNQIKNGSYYKQSACFNRMLYDADIVAMELSEILNYAIPVFKSAFPEWQKMYKAARSWLISENSRDELFNTLFKETAEDLGW